MEDKGEGHQGRGQERRVEDARNRQDRWRLRPCRVGAEIKPRAQRRQAAQHRRGAGEPVCRVSAGGNPRIVRAPIETSQQHPTGALARRPLLWSSGRTPDGPAIRRICGKTPKNTIQRHTALFPVWMEAIGRQGQHRIVAQGKVDRSANKNDLSTVRVDNPSSSCTSQGVLFVCAHSVKVCG